MDTKKLRQKILDLAIRGKLVPQDPNDEPASILLERIRAEKERLIKEGKIKRSKKTATDDEIEAPFKIPESWEWTTISEIASSILYGVSESAKGSGNYKLLRITDIQNNKVKWETVPFTNYDENKAQPYLLQDGDILFARTGATVGKSYLVEGLSQPSIYASYLIRVQTPSVMLPSYIKCFFESGYYWEQISLSSVGIGQPNVNGTTLAGLSIPIPPYQEQLRISNEVERWFAVIDELENNEGDLLKAIDQAKSKILDLAIHGKLVPQDPNDEPAIDLLKRINPKFELRDKDICSFELPNSWEWSTIGEIASSILYGVSESAKDSGNYKLLRITDIQNNKVNWQTVPFADFDDKKALSYLLQDGDILFARTGATVGKSYLVEGISQPSIYASYLIRVRTTNMILPTYIKKYFESSYYWEQITSNSVGIGQPNVNGTILACLSIPIPPYHEQHRIVAKIEELITVLDSIKESLE